jgi:hypothetical protein
VFCRMFEKVSKYPYCLNIHSKVPYSCLFGVSFVKFGVRWKFLLGGFCILMLHILNHSRKQDSSCYSCSYVKLIHLSFFSVENQNSVQDSPKASEHTNKTVTCLRK